MCPAFAGVVLPVALSLGQSADSHSRTDTVSPSAQIRWPRGRLHATHLKCEHFQVKAPVETGGWGTGSQPWWIDLSVGKERVQWPLTCCWSWAELWEGCPQLGGRLACGAARHRLQALAILVANAGSKCFATRDSLKSLDFVP